MVMIPLTFGDAMEVPTNETTSPPGEAADDKSEYLKELGDHYDRLTYSPLFRDYFGWGEFMNFGYWEADTQSIHEAAVNLGRKLIGMFPTHQGLVLDVACGKGANSQLLLEHYQPQQIIGINISAKQLESCRQNVPGAKFLEMDATQLEFEDQSIDNILCVEAAFHFDTREQFLAEAYRVLKPGGRLVLSDVLMSREAEEQRPFRIAANYVENPAAYEKLLQRAGFGPVEVIDATEKCWHGFYWYVVRMLHGKVLRGELTATKAKTYLDITYRRVPVLNYYPLAWAQK